MSISWLVRNFPTAFPKAVAGVGPVAAAAAGGDVLREEGEGANGDEDEPHHLVLFYWFTNYNLCLQKIRNRHFVSFVHALLTQTRIAISASHAI